MVSRLGDSQRYAVDTPVSMPIYVALFLHSCNTPSYYAARHNDVSNYSGGGNHSAVFGHHKVETRCALMTTKIQSF